MTRCRSCQAPIRFARTKNGKPMPLDPEPDPVGNVVIDANGTAHVAATADQRSLAEHMGWPLYMPHHATCPQAHEWKTR